MSARYPFRFDSPKLKAAMQRLARANGRSLNQEINQACKRAVEEAKEK